MMTNNATEKFEEKKLAVEKASDFGLICIRSVSILNGGGALALLTFMGNLSQNEASRCLAAQLVPSLISFFIGAAISASVALMAYLNATFTQMELRDKNAPKGMVSMLATLTICAAVALFVLGMAAFVVGGFLSAQAFSSYWPASQ